MRSLILSWDYSFGAASVQRRIPLHSSVSSTECTNNMQTTCMLPKTMQFSWNWFFIWETVIFSCYTSISSQRTRNNWVASGRRKVDNIPVFLFSNVPPGLKKTPYSRNSVKNLWKNNSKIQYNFHSHVYNYNITLSSLTVTKYDNTFQIELTIIKSITGTYLLWLQ